MVVEDRNWFSDVAVKKVRNGRNTRFWLDRWTGDSPLCLAFPRLFSLSIQKEASVGDLRVMAGDRWVWGLELSG
ncbi:defensin/CCP-like protein [Trifolium medium]|uniref:Defensin/CCP-like protein n=1 Tax=Trifolium medium TaxID=97028 RepID=A0A392NQA0_9FABA|nr:defensin/CCP-like protein [Trifolium medium]